MFHSSAKVDPAPYNGVPFVAPVVATMVGYDLASQNAIMAKEKSLKVGIFEVGDQSSCLYR